MSSAEGPFTQEAAAQLRQLLGHLVSSDNAERSQAEQQLNQLWMVQHPDTLLQGLAHFACRDTAADIRTFAAVLFRRLAYKNAPNQQESGEALSFTVWDAVTAETRTRCMQELMASIKDEQVTSVRHKMCDTVSEVYRNCAARGQSWDDLKVLLFELSGSQNADQRDCAFRVFAAVPAILESQAPQTIHQVFAQRLADENAIVRLSAMRAYIAFVMEAEVRVRNSFASLMPQVLEVLSSVAAQHDDETTGDALNIYIELAERLPKLFRPVLANLVTICVKIVQEDGQFEERTRQSALELLLTLCEAAPSMLKKVPNFAATVVPLCLKMMSELEDDKEWYTAEELDDGDNDENYIIGEQAMDRLARALGGSHILPVSFQYIPGMLHSELWQQRHAALMAISAIAEGCAKIMENELGKVIELVLPFFRDAHPRVRYAACNAIGQMSTDFAGVLQSQFHQPVLSSLIPAMDDAGQPRVQTHAAAALVNFCEAASKEMLEPYMDTMFEKLMALLNTGKMYIQEQAITTIATLADSAQDRFVKFYGVIMPMLMNVLAQAATKEFRMLRGKALECATLIALAVGKDVFAAHAPQLIALMIQTQASIADSDDPQSYYLLHAWARICKVLGADFAPYLQEVMPPLMHSAQLKPDFTIIDSEEDVESKYSAEDGWEFVGIDGQQFGIKTTVLEEKCAAVEMFVCYARELGAAFQPYVGQVLETVLPLLKFYFHEGVRFAAATVLPMLINCAKQANSNPTYLREMWMVICQRLNEVTLSEADPSFLQQLYASYAECVEELGEGCMTAEQLEYFTKAMESQLKEYYQRLNARQEEREAHGYDADDEDGLGLEEEEDDAMLAEMSKALHMIIKAHREGFFQYFDRLLGFVDHFLANPNVSSRQWALCVVDDIIEFTGPASWRYQSHFLNQLLQSITDQSYDIRQAAAYGVGMAAQHGGAQYHDACAAAVPLLLKVAQSPDARSEDNVFATENAVSAITKICKFASTKVDLNATIPVWFACLPMLEDEEEAPMTYEFLLNLLDR
ncbi:armadillo-type protein [Thamnocephalis sphaerospora]|uniref:Armadillo-type protein n=1 Tax=Thamnocephalis sphaerospora TaxID=78915 RepID=A0A4P9XV56_9FUNG|nr:armadillo-type protein [Thamnocephalis sphaerospora]|eukprot:RKP10154.1 armadillo-type protein [Thamnocephalis sphaerospora]